MYLQFKVIRPYGDTGRSEPTVLNCLSHTTHTTCTQIYFNQEALQGHYQLKSAHNETLSLKENPPTLRQLGVQQSSSDHKYSERALHVKMYPKEQPPGAGDSFVRTP